MPNNYTNAVLMYCDTYNNEGEPLLLGLLKTWGERPMMRLAPQPAGLNHADKDVLSDEAYAWRKEHWGTKWDVYSVIVEKLPGDCSPVLLTFNTAWNAPNSKMRALMMMFEWRTMGAGAISWLGMNPFDTSIKRLESSVGGQ